MAGGIKGMDGQQGGQDAFGFDPRKLVINSDFNPRSQEELRRNIDRLKPLIVAAGGVVQPVLVYVKDEQVVLHAGESRVRAMLELIDEGIFKDEVLPDGRIKTVTVPTLYRRGAGIDEKQRRLDALMENEGCPLTDADKGAAYAWFLDNGWEISQLVAKTGQSERYINSCLALASAPQELKSAVAEGTVSKGAALAATKQGTQAVESLKAQVAEKKAKGEKGPVKRAKAKAPKADKPKDVSSLVLYAAENLAVAVDRWLEDATDGAEKNLIKAHAEYRKLIRAPKQQDVAA